MPKNRYVDMEKFRKYRNVQRKKNYAKTAKYQKRPWTDNEDKKVLAHTVSDTVLSVDIQRSVQSIQVRRCRLKKE